MSAVHELLDQIEALENNPNSYVGGLQGQMNGNELKAAVQKKLASLQKKVEALAGDDEDSD